MFIHLKTATLLAWLSGMWLVGCVSTESSVIDDERYSSNEIELIERCLETKVEAPRARVDDPAVLNGDYVAQQIALPIQFQRAAFGLLIEEVDYITSLIPT